MKKQYLRLILIYHPDRTRDSASHSICESMCKTINGAYETNDAATLDAIESYGQAFREYIPQPPPLPDATTAEQRERDKKWADIMRARAEYAQRSDFAKACEAALDFSNYSPYLMAHAWSIGWEQNGGRRNAHAMVVSTAWAALLYYLYLKLPIVESAAIAVFPAHSAGLRVIFVSSQIIVFLAALPFLLPLALIWFMLAAEWTIIYVAFLILHSVLSWFHPALGQLAYVPAVAGYLFILRVTLDPWGWR